MSTMDPCVCSTVRHLAKNYDEKKAGSLASDINSLLRDLRALLLRSKSLARDVEYQITPTNQRAMKALEVKSVNLRPIDDVCTKYKDDIPGFWTASDDAVHAGLHRRLVCAVVFLRSKLDSGSKLPLIPPQIATSLGRNHNTTELKNSGRKYIKIARKLGGIASLFWLPLDIPHSTYERYLSMDDEEVFQHLESLKPLGDCYADFARQLLLSQFQDLPLSCSYHNLFPHYSDSVPPSEQLLLLLYALGGANVPLDLLESIRSPQRRWNESGEISTTTAIEFDLPPGLISLVEKETQFQQVLTNPHIIQHVNDDGIALLSLSPETMAFFSTAFLPVTMAELNETALRILCFATPACYEGNTYWSAAVKAVIWPLLDKMAKPDVVQEPLRTQAVVAVLYFCERDSVPLRIEALVKAKALLRRSMPYYLHASVVLFQSILDRVENDVSRSEAVLRDFLVKGVAKTRRDSALLGRLHISQIDNKIRSYDMDVPLLIYGWKAQQPLSLLEIQVTSRLQGVAARFFQSVGDFAAAAASMEQFLSLESNNLIQTNTRRLIVGRLGDIYCELQAYDKAATILRPVMEGTNPSEHIRRPYRRLLLSFAEAHIGMERLDDAEQILEQVRVSILPIQPLRYDNIHDQQLHMRSLIASARIAHLQHDLDEAIRRWGLALQGMRDMHAPNWLGSFTEAMIHLSLAHAQMLSGDSEGTTQSWKVGIDILRREKCEFWIPIVPTLWLKQIVMQVHEQMGWSFRMMLPGGKPDMTWPF
ncbi:hypothetical protein SEUCBS139899_010678 [Sporothrix eucalyptigena]|uniref:Uncharacterized protein n=1 Tax=Sporothrix eucalyptigena TaxID=1812306 RepID=A0ABP0B9D3_9PEZI